MYTKPSEKFSLHKLYLQNHRVMHIIDGYLQNNFKHLFQYDSKEKSLIIIKLSNK